MNARSAIDVAYAEVYATMQREHSEAIRAVDRRAPDAGARLDAICDEFSARYADASRAYRVECGLLRARERAARALRA